MSMVGPYNNSGFRSAQQIEFLLRDMPNKRKEAPLREVVEMMRRLWREQYIATTAGECSLFIRKCEGVDEAIELYLNTRKKVKS